ncbi:MAG: hypothetical protein N2595_08430, partial [bacterium]|nr:hypothetical protein [bacterium]
RGTDRGTDRHGRTRTGNTDGGTEGGTDRGTDRHGRSRTGDTDGGTGGRGLMLGLVNVWLCRCGIIRRCALRMERFRF